MKKRRLANVHSENHQKLKLTTIKDLNAPASPKPPLHSERQKKTLDIYPDITKEVEEKKKLPENIKKKVLPGSPTFEDIEKAKQIITENIKLYDHGHVIVYDHNKDKKVKAEKRRLLLFCSSLL